ncbi:uncharacterized protein LOC142319921 [Lycorma delicatula]|uniref:uncharacterized protein LOC142319921 n=1 Tax=Lycorma delicatula TaxID=130591 RepID=UPI003F5127CB
MAQKKSELDVMQVQVTIEKVIDTEIIQHAAMEPPKKQRAPTERTTLSATPKISLWNASMEGITGSTVLNKSTVSTNNNVSNTTLRQHRLQPPHPQINKTSSSTKTTEKSKTTVKLCFFKVQLTRGLHQGRQSPQMAIPLVASSNDNLQPDSAVDANNVNVSYNSASETESTYTFTRHAIRSNYMDKSIEAKKKVIRMLFVVIGEFFICWAPLHILNTIYLFSPEFFRMYHLGKYMYLVQILAFISSCCNPITYCFMNRKFRQAFLSVFKCHKCHRFCCCCASEVIGGPLGNLSRLGDVAGGPNNSEISGNDSTLYIGRGCRSEVVVLDAEERV